MELDPATAMPSWDPIRVLLIAMTILFTSVGNAQETPPLLAALRGLEERGMNEIWPAVEDLKRALKAAQKAGA